MFLSWFFLATFRIIARNLIPVVRRHFGVLRYVLIVGLGDRALRLAQNLESYHEYGLRIVGFLACVEDQPAPANDPDRKRIPRLSR